LKLFSDRIELSGNVQITKIERKIIDTKEEN
jgi:hypothetical protein